MFEMSLFRSGRRPLSLFPPSSKWDLSGVSCFGFGTRSAWSARLWIFNHSYMLVPQFDIQIKTFLGQLRLLHVTDDSPFTLDVISLSSAGFFFFWLVGFVVDVIITAAVRLFFVSSCPSLQSPGGQPDQCGGARSLSGPPTAGEAVSTPS